MILIKWILLIAIVISGQCKVEIIKSVSLKEAMAKNNITYREVTPTSIIVANIALKSCGVDKECVIFYLCHHGKPVTDGFEIIDLRFSNIQLNNKTSNVIVNETCTSYTDVCCDTPNIQVTPKTVTITHPFATKCGVLNKDGCGMIFNETYDHLAQFGEFPWMVAVLTREKIFKKNQAVHQFGGSLIHPSVVLTAAHKIHNLVSTSTLFVRAGEWDTQTKGEPFPYVESNVESFVLHDNYKRGTTNSKYVVALMFLETPIGRAEHINTICLPPSNFNFDSSRCFVTGWGKNAFGKEGKFAEVLKKVDLPMIDVQKCEQMFRATKLGYGFVFEENLICAGGEEGKDACEGDGGSPLVCPVPGNEGHYYQAGIVAWGIGCGLADTPGAYINVALFTDWIAEQMQIKKMNTSSYTL